MARSAETKAVSKKSSDDLDKGKKKSTKSFIPLAGDGGGIKKKKKPARPLSAESKLLNAQAREGLSKGNIVAEMEQRRKERDQRTLYIKFPAENLPTSEAEIENIHPHVEQIRVTRQARQKKDGGIAFCFAEFASAEKCLVAKQKLHLSDFKGGQLQVNIAGEKDRKDRKPRTSLNPTRLFVSGAVKLKISQLRSQFPKATNVLIPSRSAKHGKKFAFVQFSSPGDAKAAFDAAAAIKRKSDLPAGEVPLTVLYAKLNQKEKKKASKRASNSEAESEVVTPKKKTKDKGNDSAKNAKQDFKDEEAEGPQGVTEEDEAEVGVTSENEASDEKNDNSEEAEEDNSEEAEEDNSEEAGEDNSEEAEEEEFENDEESDDEAEVSGEASSDEEEESSANDDE